MDAIRKKDTPLGITPARVDHQARMDRVDTALQEQSVAVAQLNPQQLSDLRGYQGTALETIQQVTTLGPSTTADHKQLELKGGHQLPDILKTPEQKEKELEEKIREKTDPEFAAQKKAERTAAQLHQLLNPLFMGLIPSNSNPIEQANLREDAKHQSNLEIIDILLELNTDEMKAVSTEYEKKFGKSLEDDIRSRFRGDVQQKLLEHVRGEGGKPEGGEQPKDA